MSDFSFMSKKEEQRILALQEIFLKTDFRDYLLGSSDIMAEGEAESFLAYLLRNVERGNIQELPNNMLRKELELFVEHSEILFFSGQP